MIIGIGQVIQSICQDLTFTVLQLRVPNLNHIKIGNTKRLSKIIIEQHFPLHCVVSQMSSKKYN